MYELIIVGSGPAGLSAAIYAGRAGLSALVIEEQPLSGGQIINTYEVDNYPGIPGVSGFDLAQKMRQHAQEAGTEFSTERVVGMEVAETVKKIRLPEKELCASAIILATGAEYRRLGVPGEKELTGKGVSYCATCDGAFFRGRSVAVVGGGDVALEDAIFLARGCEKVYLIHRRGELRGARRLQEQVFGIENIEVRYHTVVKAIRGSGQVDQIDVCRKDLDTCESLMVSGVFIAVGMLPRQEALPEGIAQDENGYVVADETCCTNIDGVFAAGDIRTKQLRQVVTAVADGANAVTSAEHYLNSCRNK
ncbi:MAG: FAD-dependent oxidoreductase [Lachnospiraceae bacterium]|nr:FAD-dependent oxidoreductase [Lachnospiraceae bacterium]